MPILTPTTLVLGAGASNDYRFPTGGELLDQVFNDSDLRGHICTLVPDYDDVRNFLEQLRYSGDSSVDAFLEKNPKFERIGKYTIAAALLPLEDPLNLFPPKVGPHSHWYQLLIDRMGVGTDEWFSNNLSVITFNYDRSFEQYFMTVIATRAKLSAENARETFQHIQVVHVHGSLGGFPPGAPGTLPYGVNMAPDNISRAARGIGVVTEVNSLDPEFEAAEKILRGSERIYFLGFGFHPDNVRRLRIFDDLAPDQDGRPFIGGMSKGFSPREWDVIVEERLNGVWDDERYESNVYDFLRHGAAWD